MSVYDLDRKGLGEVFLEFHTSLYGRTVFFFAYFIPFVLFIAAALLALFSIFDLSNAALANASIACILAFVPSFIIGNAYFYSEVRKYCAHKEKKSSRSEHKK